MVKQKTREELTLEIGALQATIKSMEAQDLLLREDLSGLLESYEVKVSPESIARQRVDYVSRPNVLSWRGICFKIGELKSDADYTLLLERDRMQKQEIGEFRNRIAQLEQHIRERMQPKS